MRHMNAIKIGFFLYLTGAFSVYAQKKNTFEGWQRISVKKEKIFILFKHDKKCDRRLKFYRKEEKGVVFNLGCKKYGSCLFKNNLKSDTLPLKELSSYNITTMEALEEKITAFRKKTYRKLPPKDNYKLYQAYNKNDIFQTYLIEIINNKKFVVYPVVWRNQGVIKEDFR